MVHSCGMNLMLTLFHHSLPLWAGDYGGWKLEKTVDYSVYFMRLIVENMSDIVDYWVTFNEPHVFCLFTYATGAWPGSHPNMLGAATSALPTSAFRQAMHWMAMADIKAYDCIHAQGTSSRPVVGVAHHVSFMRPYGLFDEVVSGARLKLAEDDEYSESGRGVYPDGLYRVLLQFHERYKHLNIPFIITENGVSNETDLIRRPYLLEHLLAVYAAMIMGNRVIGYLFWTISDNWEWAEGYGPKFALVAVDQANGFARTPRPSYHLFPKVATTSKIKKEDRDSAWNELYSAVKDGKNVYLRDIWPSNEAITKENPMWNQLTVALYSWDLSSTYIHRPPYFKGMSMSSPGSYRVKDAYYLFHFGDNIKTDHISLTGSIHRDSPTARYLMERGVDKIRG
ncbi:hypothetical protein CRG98_033692 [Punica granatum]|nr:hypothetical protein CRG98_033692 [Punica granatum]